MIKKEEIIEEALYYINEKSTYRKMAKKFNKSIYLINKDLSIYLKDIDLSLFNKVNKMKEFNSYYKCYKGGNSTRIKYLSK